MDNLTINGVEYAPVKTGEMQFTMVRGVDSGVFAGYLKSRNGREVELINARRIWYWEGAASLSELAERGTKKPNECKFPMPVKRVLILDAVELIDISDEAKNSIDSVPIWTA